MAIPEPDSKDKAAQEAAGEARRQRINEREAANYRRIKKLVAIVLIPLVAFFLLTRIQVSNTPVHGVIEAVDVKHTPTGTKIRAQVMLDRGDLVEVQLTRDTVITKGTKLKLVETKTLLGKSVYHYPRML